ncbi:MAG: hypothetical protein ACUVWN_08945 [bacterium]
MFLLIVTICILAFMPFNGGLCDTYDDDPVLEFYWEPATGNVDHYNVYLSTDGSDYVLVGTTPTAPTQENPYAVPITAVDGKVYRLKVEAADAEGNVGPMSEPSDPVTCKLRSPGDISCIRKGDIDDNRRVGSRDWSIFCASYGKRRGEAGFDYRADVDYDDLIGISDLNILRTYWGVIY